MGGHKADAVREDSGRQAAGALVGLVKAANYRTGGEMGGDGGQRGAHLVRGHGEKTAAAPGRRRGRCRGSDRPRRTSWAWRTTSKSGSQPATVAKRADPLRASASDAPREPSPERPRRVRSPPVAGSRLLPLGCRPGSDSRGRRRPESGPGRRGVDASARLQLAAHQLDGVRFPGAVARLLPGCQLRLEACRLPGGAGLAAHLG